MFPGLYFEQLQDTGLNDSRCNARLPLLLQPRVICLMPETRNIYTPVPQEVSQVCGEVLNSLAERTGRKDFLRVVAESLYPVCRFSWLTISLREQPEEMFADFSNPDKIHINPLAPVMPRSLTSTIAEYVHDTRESLIIPDCVEYFIDMASPPIFQQSAASTISLPLMLNNEIFASLHLGYENRPDNLYKLASFVSQICPSVAAGLGVVRSLERMRGTSEAPESGERTDPLSETFDATVVFRSRAMNAVIRQLNVLTNLDVPVLLLGETGTGKSMIARHIHDNSLRKSGRFVRVNCPSLASSLFESEMFGHAKGSFTGATKNRVGRFELAHKGTLFLDEVAELSMDMQSKLLQVLDDSSFERVGESVPIMVDMRIVAATNVHIGEAISQGRLRGDLFHRISVYTIELPPLRQRPDDIPPLARVLSAQSAAKVGLPDLAYTHDVLTALCEYYWPGNTRELSNLVTRLVIAQSVHGEITRPLIKEAIDQSESYFLAENAITGSLISNGAQRPAAKAQPEINNELTSLADAERQHILKILEHTGGVVSGPKGAARVLGLPRSTLINRMNKLGIRASASAQAGSCESS